MFIDYISVQPYQSNAQMFSFFLAATVACGTAEPCVAAQAFSSRMSRSNLDCGAGISRPLRSPAAAVVRKTLLAANACG